MIIDLLRHASTGRTGFLDGSSDPALLPDAAGKVAAAHGALSWQTIVSSPRRRARDTASALSAQPARIDSQWAELHFGDWEGMATHELDSQQMADFFANPNECTPPGGEPWRLFEARIRQALTQLLTRHDDNACVLVVSHAGAIRMALSIVLGWPYQATWGLRIAYGTRARLRIGQHNAALWGELLELTTP